MIKSYFRNLLTLIRLPHYIKNIIIFLPLFFSNKVLEYDLLMKAIVAFIAFSLCSSSIYILNDFFDIEDDRLHPKKKYRPLAAGTISKKAAFIYLIFFLLIGGMLLTLLSWKAGVILGIYVFMNFAYSLGLKHFAILDIVIIAIGFVLRIFVGSVTTGVPPSNWIVLLTFLLALFIALGKRRDDVLVFMETGKKMRKVIDGYNLRFLEGTMMIMASVVIVTYILYTTSVEVIQRLHNGYVYLTTIFVIVGILRYLQIVLLENKSGEPTQIVLKDNFMRIIILAWLISFIWILYL
jgi:decaprenyl-phosphate phosphoribosyltransferase